MSKIILETIVGSTLHGTSVDDGLEDLDLMAIMLEEPEEFIGFVEKDTLVNRTKPEGVRSEAGDVDYVAYGLKKYLNLALKGNPTLLLVLFAPENMIRQMKPEGKMLQELAPHIVSKQIYNPFKGYMRQQHERMLGTRGQLNVTRPELVEKYGFDTKYAGHVVRLGLQGKELLETGKLILPMPKESRELVVSVRTGGYTLEQVSSMIIELEKQLTVAYEASTLPDTPNVNKVQSWMINTYLRYWN